MLFVTGLTGVSLSACWSFAVHYSCVKNGGWKVDPSVSSKSIATKEQLFSFLLVFDQLRKQVDFCPSHRIPLDLFLIDEGHRVLEVQTIAHVVQAAIDCSKHF